MRYGVLADVHGNLFALRAALAALAAEGVDAYLCAGDLVGFGPHPNECVETVADLGATCVAGNHELIALGVLSDERCSTRARDSQRWTRAVLRDDVRGWLRRLPTTATLPGVVMAHGSLDDPEEYVKRDAQAAGQLRQLAAEHPSARTLVLGHTHRSWLYREGAGTVPVPRDGAVSLEPSRRHLLNPGSVGQSRQREREPRARFAVFDPERSQARFHAIGYDVDACRVALRRHGLPADSVHHRPPLAAAVAHRAEAAVRRVVRSSA